MGFENVRRLLPAAVLGVWLVAASPPLRADPFPLLSSFGPWWVGPLRPDRWSEVGAYGAQVPLGDDPRGVWIIDPRSGTLQVHTRDLVVRGEPLDLALDRVWTGREWTSLGLDRLSLLRDRFLIERPGFANIEFKTDALGNEPPACPGMTPLRSGREHLLECQGTFFVARMPDGARVGFDPTGRVAYREGPRGGRLGYRWDGPQLVAIEMEDGRKLSFSTPSPTGAPPGLLLRAVRGHGAEVSEEIDEGRLMAVTNADGLRTRYLYDARKRLEGAVWPDGSFLRVTYDEASRVSSFRGPGSRSARLEWSKEGLSSLIDEVGGVWKVSWREDGVALADPTGRAATLLLDGGAVIGWMDPAGRRTRVQRDAGGRPRGFQDAAGGDWRVDVDGQGAVTSLVQPGGADWRYERDEQGRLLRLVAPDGRSLRMGRDTRGRIEEVQRGLERVTLRRDERGLVREIAKGTGASIVLERDSLGRVVAIKDASGNAFVLSERSGGWARAILEPDGTRWTLLLDALLRPVGLEPHPRGVHRWTHDGLGRIGELRVGSRVTRFGRRMDGATTRVVDPEGRVTGWFLDSAGRSASLRRSDGSVLQFSRDSRGDIATVRLGETTLRVERDAMGRLLALRAMDRGGAVTDSGTEPPSAPSAALTLKRDARGRVVELAFPEGVLRLARDLAGRARQIVMDGRSLELARDGAGRLVRVVDAGATWTLTRDLSGSPRAYQGPGTGLTIERDIRTLPVRLTAGPLQVQWSYDASGRLQRLKSAQGVTLGITYGPGGRVASVRYPDASLGWFREKEGLEEQRFEDPRGRLLQQRLVGRDLLGRPEQVDEQGVVTRFRRGALGELVAVEVSEGGWSRARREIEGPTGERILLDGAGRPLEALSTMGPPPWNLGAPNVAYRPDAVVRGVRIEGESGSVTLLHDLLGRITTWTVRQREKGRERIVAAADLSYDPLGLLVDEQGSRERRLVTFEGRILGILGVSGAEHLLVGPMQAAVHVDPAGRITALWPDASGNPSLAWDGERTRIVRYSPSGYADSTEHLPLGASLLLSLLPGGALLGPLEGYDPLTGQGTADALVVYPWATPAWGLQGATAWPRLDGATAWDWDPAWWDSTLPWSRPLDLLLAWGLLRLPEEEANWIPGPSSGPLPWLPASLEGGDPPLGPAWWGWPVALDPLSAFLVRRLLEGELPLDGNSIVSLLLEPHRDEVPPGLPGLGEAPYGACPQPVNALASSPRR